MLMQRARWPGLLVLALLLGSLEIETFVHSHLAGAGAGYHDPACEGRSFAEPATGSSPSLGAARPDAPPQHSHATCPPCSPLCTGAAAGHATLPLRLPVGSSAVRLADRLARKDCRLGHAQRGPPSA